MHGPSPSLHKQYFLILFGVAQGGSLSYALPIVLHIDTNKTHLVHPNANL